MKVVTVGTSPITSICINAMKAAGIDVIACVGRSLERTKAFAEKNDVDFYSNDYDKVLKDKSYDTVYIAVPNRLHFEYAKKALLAGKNVVVEKPMCANFKEAKELVRIALKSGKFLFENNKVPHNAALREIKKDLDKLGDLKMVNLNFSKVSTRYYDFKAGEKQNMFSLEMCSGALVDMNIYNISLAIYLFGMPKETLYLANKTDHVDTSGVALMRYDGFIVNCVTCKDSNSTNYVDIAGENGVIHTSDQASMINTYTLISNGEKEFKDYHDDNQFIPPFKNFKAMIEYSAKDTVDAYLKQSLMTIKVLDDLRKSANIVYPCD